jgi:hypothetical protein
MIGSPVSSALDAEIRAAIDPQLPRSVLDITAGRSPALAIKYMPAFYAARYHKAAEGLKISDTPGFTWGRATYVAPLSCPLSGGIFGRVGVVAQLKDHHEWKTFDARDPGKAELYLRWLQQQARYRDVMLTAHSAYLSQLYRDAFRRKYLIDCVLFRPDQSNRAYTSVHRDVWMAVTDWVTIPGKLKTIATGTSERFIDPRLTVVLEEEFTDAMGGIHRTALLNLGSRPPADRLAEDIWDAYRRGEIVRVLS